MRKSFYFLVMLLFVIVIIDSAWANGKGTNNGRVSQLRVMTLNFYIGADILGVSEPSPCGALQSVNNLFEEIVMSDPVARAEVHADLIAQRQPDVVALQEMYRISKQVPSNSFVFNPSIPGFEFDNFEVNEDDSITFIPDADVVVFDYLDLLLDALTDRGLQYEVVEDAMAYESDFEFPSWDLDPDLGCNPEPGALPTDIRAEDRDAILVKSGISYDNGTAANYSNLLPFTIPTGTGPDVQIIVMRGYGATDITHQGRTHRIVNTHLEVDDQSDPNSPINLIQAAQAQELIAVLEQETLPLVVAGDFNSSPDPDDVSSAYELIVAAGYEDIWTQFDRRPGNTCCQAPDLMNFKSELFKRIDLILLRPPDDAEFLPSPMWVTGDRQSDKTDPGLWPSDHASVSATIKLKQ
jgi:endonuclease/exonuclease/phosphatase family metal-dependent hydrolase